MRVATFGESHGAALGAVVDGCPAGIKISAADFQRDLDRRKPGKNKISTARKESDAAKILSGIFENKTIGTPIAVAIFNEDQRSRDYSQVEKIFRPGHADEVFFEKFGTRDFRGGGRSSGRETVGRVIGGTIAKKILPKKTKIFGHVAEIFGEKINKKNFDPTEIEKNPVRCGDKNSAEKFEKIILDAKKNGDSVGGVAEFCIQNCPKNLGDPVFGKLKSRLGGAILSLGGVFSCEIFPAKKISKIFGSAANKISTGISGGISTGDEIILRAHVRPTPSIAKIQKMKKIGGGKKKIAISGRHDPCILPRLIPAAEAMIALVLADALLENRLARI